MYRTFTIVLFLALAGCSSPESSPLNPEGPNLDAFDIANEPYLGDADAPVMVLAFEAPACSACRNFHLGSHAGSLTDLQMRFIDPGVVRFVAYQWTIGAPYDQTGGVAAECAFREGGNDAYFDATRRIFNNQFQGDDALAEMLRTVAQQHDFDGDAAVDCFETGATLDEVQGDITYGRAELNAYQSPAFFVVDAYEINGPIGAKHLESFVESAAARNTNSA